MFSFPTVIILGAGSSADFNLPLGKELWTRIVKDSEQLPEHLSSYSQNNPFANADAYLRHASQTNPKAFAFFSMMRNARGAIEHEPVKALAETVKRANVHDSVDDFVRDHPSLKKSMQVLTAGNLFQNLYEQDSDRSKWKLRERLFALTFKEPFNQVNVTENWLRYFIGLCRNHLQQLSQGEGVCPVTVISFNYDRLMETVLRRHWDQSELSYPKVDDCFSFLYPYGAFSDLKRDVDNPGPWLIEEASQIAITGNGPSPQKTVARKALREAHQIYMLGFSCSTTNMNWLGLDDELGKKIIAQNYNFDDQRLRRVLKSLNAQSDKGSMIDLVRNGFFEQGVEAAFIDPPVG